ncbi:MAG: hypothetical protein IJ113_08625, partial [Eggerthellaceae bacterium]|nr:hypothetical protein [Eggerthellaceae bacterium]
RSALRCVTEANEGLMCQQTRPQRHDASNVKAAFGRTPQFRCVTEANEGLMCQQTRPQRHDASNVKAAFGRTPQ